MPVQASFGRRFLALSIDWVVCLAITGLVTKSKSGEAALLPLAIFYLEVVLLTILTGASFGQRMAGLRVVNDDGSFPVAPLRILERTTLLSLVFPALLSKEGRGYHDLLSSTVVTRVIGAASSRS